MKTRKGHRLVLVAVPLVAALAWIVVSLGGGTGVAPEVRTTPRTDTGAPGEGDQVRHLGDPARRSVADAGGELEVLRILGRVLDPTGEPLPGALVGDVTADRPAVTAPDGRFDLRVEPGRGSVTLLVLAAGQAPFLSSQDMDPASRSHDAGDIQLARAGAIRGRITDIDGNGLAGATATLELRDWNSWLPLDVAELHPPVSTDAEGNYAFADLMPGRYRIAASAPGMEHRESGTARVREGEETVVDPIALGTGLRITGTAVDARTGRPVERFAASIRRVGELDPQSNGTMAQQLERHIESLRASAAAASDPEARERGLAIAAQFDARLERVRSGLQTRPVSVPLDPGPVADHPEGGFSFEGLREGLYAIGIASPDHRYAEAGPIELRRGTPAPELRVELMEGYPVSGFVVWKHDGRPVAGATVELVRPFAEPRDAPEGRASLYPWVFARSGPQGVTLDTAQTGSDGSFAFRQAAPGRFFLSVRHPETADRDTEPFELQAPRTGLRIAVGARATLTGRVGNVPLGQEGNVSVLVLGGHGTMRTAKAEADATYRLDGLQPGSYLVRAFPSDDGQFVNRLFGSIFPLYAGAVDPDRIPPRDVTLAEGETRVFDVLLDMPPTGAVRGSITVNGQPRGGGRAILRPVPGEAPGSGGLSLRASYDDLGQFTIADVPAGNYTLVLSGPTRQELYSEPLTVRPGTTEPVQLDLAAGGLRGRVVTDDGATPDELRGTLWVLPGATEVPSDPYEYRRTHRTHRVRIRNGVFDDEGLTPGPAVLILDLRDREQAVREVVIPSADVLVLDLTAGPRIG